MNFIDAYAAAAFATLTTEMTGANNDLTFTAVVSGASGEDITIAHNHTTDPRIRGRGIECFGGLRERSAHAIGIGENFHIVSISGDTTF